MANKTQTQDPQTASSADPSKAVTQLQDAGIGNMMGMGTAWLEAVGKMNLEMVGFVAARITEDVKTQQEIMECRSVSDLSHIQAQFMQKAMDQYKAETGKLVVMGNKALGNKNDGELAKKLT